MSLEQHSTNPDTLVFRAKQYKLDSTETTAVATEFYWLPINNDTPRGVKVLLLGRGGVASLGHYHHKPGESEFWTHWAPLPRIKPCQLKNP
jgi:hypothetical protein